MFSDSTGALIATGVWLSVALWVWVWDSGRPWLRGLLWGYVVASAAGMIAYALFCYAPSTSDPKVITQLAQKFLYASWIIGGVTFALRVVLSVPISGR